MRGDQLARDWGIFRAIEASSNGLTFSEIANHDGQGRRIDEKPLKSLFRKLGWAFLLWGGSQSQ